MCLRLQTQIITFLVAFGALLQGTLDFSESCNGPLSHVLDKSVVVFGRFVIQTSEYDINRGTNFTSKYKVICCIAGCFVFGASVCCHGKWQTNVSVFLVLKDGLGKDAIQSSVKSLDLVCRRLIRSRPKLLNTEEPADFVHDASIYFFSLVTQNR